MDRDVKSGVKVISPYVHDGVRQQCIEAINRCPTKALLITRVDGKELLSLDSKNCFSCGDCVRLATSDNPYICNLIMPAFHQNKIAQWIKNGIDFGFLIGPGLEYYTDRINLKQVATACKKIGAIKVYQTSGAALPASRAIKDEIVKRWISGDNVIIDSRCGAIRNYVIKFRPDLVDNLIKSNSTLLESARLARQGSEKELVFCFIGPDIAYKEAIYYSLGPAAELVNAVITWHEFEMLCDEYLNEPIYEMHESEFDKFSVQVEDGFIPDAVNFEGKLKGVPYLTMADKDRTEIIRFLEKLDSSERKGFIEVLWCRSCIHGPGVFSRWSLEQERKESQRRREARTTPVESIPPKPPMVIIREVKVNNTYNIGQAGAVGPNAHADHITFQQVWDQSALDISRLAQELARLRNAMEQENEGTAEQDRAIDAVTAAERAAAQGDGATVVRHLKTAGKWTLGIAEKIGVAIAAKAIQSTMGMPE